LCRRRHNPDNGSEFINYHLVKYCGGDDQHAPILLSRSRPEHKNDCDDPHALPGVA